MRQEQELQSRPDRAETQGPSAAHPAKRPERPPTAQGSGPCDRCPELLWMPGEGADQ